MRVALAILPLVLSWTSASVAQGGVRQEEPVVIELRLAEDAPGHGRTEAEVSGQAERVYLHSRVELSSEQLARVEAEVGDSAVLINLWLTKEGSERLAGLTAANVGRRLAVVIDTRVVAAAAIVQPLSPGTERPVTVSVHLPRREGERLAQSIARTWPRKAQ
jgi:preprotein translocase subunit SecD